MNTNHPIDSLGKLRITEASINPGTIDFEINYLSGCSTTTVVFIRYNKTFRIFDHYDFIGNNRPAIEMEIEEHREELQQYMEHLIDMED